MPETTIVTPEETFAALSDDELAEALYGVAWEVYEASLAVDQLIDPDETYDLSFADLDASIGEISRGLDDLYQRVAGAVDVALVRWAPEALDRRWETFWRERAPDRVADELEGTRARFAKLRALVPAKGDDDA